MRPTGVLSLRQKSACRPPVGELPLPRRHLPADVEDGIPITSPPSKGGRTFAHRAGGASCLKARATPAGIQKSKRARHTCRARRADEIG